MLINLSEKQLSFIILKFFNRLNNVSFTLIPLNKKFESPKPRLIIEFSNKTVVTISLLVTNYSSPNYSDSVAAADVDNEI